MQYHNTNSNITRDNSFTDHQFNFNSINVFAFITYIIQEVKQELVMSRACYSTKTK